MKIRRTNKMVNKSDEKEVTMETVADPQFEALKEQLNSAVVENTRLKDQNQKLTNMVNRLYSLYSDLLSKYLEA